MIGGLRRASRRISSARADSGTRWLRFAGIDLGVIDHKNKKLHRFRAAGPGRLKAKQTENTVTHVTGLW